MLKSVAFVQANGIDVLINNAGILCVAPPPYHPPPPLTSTCRPNELNIFDVTRENLNAAFTTNTVGPLFVTLALLDLVLRSKQKKVVMTSTVAASLAQAKDFAGLGEKVPGMTGSFCVSYRLSKVALNMVAKTLALEKPELTVAAIHPGAVATDMAVDFAGSQEAADAAFSGFVITTEQSATGILNVVDGLKATDSGTFLDYAGNAMPW